ncbi:MAG: permease [Bacteroidetes bacterium SW_11_45_7]|nr:MAG: permease [Bacteroidetes bacterium SW_11_45_7]
MDLFTITGYFAALLVGMSLGLIGGGGSILAVPIFVYLLGVEPVQATAYSLVVVGVTSLVGSYSYYKKSLLAYRRAAVFAIPAVIAVFLTRKFLIPALPDVIFTTSAFVLDKGMLLMFIFGALMIVTSYSMIRGTRQQELNPEEIKASLNWPLIVGEGAVVGVLTGLVGAGGGFLIVPALVLLGRLPMKLAVGTSLLIIAIKSLVGFLGDISNDYEMAWGLLLTFTAIAVGGIFLGSFLSNYIEGNKLRPAFGWFVLVMAVYILVKEFLSGQI